MKWSLLGSSLDVLQGFKYGGKQGRIGGHWRCVRSVKNNYNPIPIPIYRNVGIYRCLGTQWWHMKAVTQCRSQGPNYLCTSRLPFSIFVISVKLCVTVCIGRGHEPPSSTRCAIVADATWLNFESQLRVTGHAYIAAFLPLQNGLCKLLKLSIPCK